MPPVEEALAENAQLKGRIAELEAQIAWFRRQMFAGGKSERLDLKQMELELKGLRESAPETETRKVSYERKAGARRRGREELYESLPVREETVIEPEEVAAHPELYERIGETVTFEIRVEPPKFYRHRIVLPKYRLKNDRSRPPIVAPAPPRVVEGLASAQLLAYIVVSKFLDHLPLHRQCAIYKRHGFVTSR